MLYSTSKSSLKGICEMELTNLYMDTHKIVRLLQEKGYTEQEAEGFIQAIQEITLTGVASKEDLRKMEKNLRGVEINLREEIIRVEKKLREESAKVKSEVAEVRKEILVAKSDLYKFMLTNSFVVVGLTVTLIKLLG